MITYRRLSTVDAPQYRAIRLEALKAHPDKFGSDYEQQRRLPKLKFEQILEDAGQDSFMIGAFAEDELIGICGFLDFFPGNPYNLEKTGVVIQMYVRAEYSGRKIGLTLINKTIEEAFKLPQIDQIYLEVVEGNISAIRIYQQAGFQLFQPPQPINNNTRCMIVKQTAGSLGII